MVDLGASVLTRLKENQRKWEVSPTPFATILSGRIPAAFVQIWICGSSCTQRGYVYLFTQQFC